MSTKAALLVLAACGSSPAPVAPPIHNEVVEHVPRVELAVATGGTVRVMHTTDTGLVVDRTVEAPAVISQMIWSGKDPIVWLDLPIDFYAHPQLEGTEPGNHSGELGRIGARYEPLAEPAWRRIANARAEESVSPPVRFLFATEGGQTWAGYCAWGFIADGVQCSETVYARVDTGPGEVVDESPKSIYAWEQRDIGGPLGEKIAGPPGYRLAMSKRPNDGHGYTKEVDVLTCTGPRGTVSYPPVPDPDSSIGYAEPTWISLSPPLFESSQAFEGYVGHLEQRFFAGCERTNDYEWGMDGPEQTIWLAGSKLEVYWHGKKVGETEPGDIAFHVDR